MVLGLGLLCGVQALLNIGLRLSLYSEWTEEKNNLVKDLEHLQSNYDLVTAERAELKFRLCESPGWQKSGRSCYYISTDWKNWTESKQWCRDRQSELIIINSKEEQDFVNKAVKPSVEVWLGLTDREEEGVWKWVDGTPLTSPTYWFHGEPNNIGGGEGEDCATKRQRSGINGWLDIPCSLTQRWMCEKALQ